MDARISRMTLSLPESPISRKITQIIRQIFENYHGKLAIRMSADAKPITFGSNSPDCLVTFNRLQPLRSLILKPDPLRMADAHFRGWMDIEGNIYTALEMRSYLNSLNLPLAEKFSLWLNALSLVDKNNEADHKKTEWAWLKPLSMTKHGRQMNREAIEFHYDVSNDFYRLWLDDKMIYSCAYFRHQADTLDDAQSNKLDLICRKLRLQAGEKLLDIGCGWGALVIWAARNYGVMAHGITLSHNQYEYAVEKIREQGLEDKVTVELKDYRDLEGEQMGSRIYRFLLPR